ncbi:hypothetical protein V6N13_060911 [Hibiscus sabdariffa]|uniref:Uncharacterized protein n=2 Tax=Hibiscus sabdariffa TaxID=183260 RepID=A0ABR2A7I1_9ROSI
MQDIHSIVGGGRIFSGGGGDRRLRPQNHNQLQLQPLKCPRCDSLNTKFCYYNNYNLSQPRHFCKSCRRYWTRGGLLRNVPVGGGCRKAKRPNTKPTSEITTVFSQPWQEHRQHQFKENSHSSSEGSSLTAADSNNNKNSSAGSTTEAASGVASHSSSINVSDSNPYNLGLTTKNGSLAASSNDETVPFGFGTTEQAQWLQQQQLKMVSMGENEIITGGLLLDPTVQVVLSGLHNRSEGGGCGGFGPFDWEGSGDERTALVDLCNQTDDHTYWSQYDPTLYLP